MVGMLAHDFANSVLSRQSLGFPVSLRVLHTWVSDKVSIEEESVCLSVMIDHVHLIASNRTQPFKSATGSTMIQYPIDPTMGDE